MKKYKLIRDYPNHQIGDIAIYNPNNYPDAFVWEKNRFNPLTGKNDLYTYVPSDFQPDVTPGWFEEVKEYKYLTKDGITICDPKQVVYGYNVTNQRVGKTIASNTSKDPTWLFFSTPEARQDYIEKLTLIFITNDNVKKYWGDKYLSINKDWKIIELTAYDKGNTNNLVSTSFDSYDRAREYVIENSPLLSYNDLWNTPGINISDSNKMKFANLARQKYFLQQKANTVKND